VRSFRKAPILTIRYKLTQTVSYFGGIGGTSHLGI
jgi:hypothetical protein